jgi:hypothetical protein
MSANQLQRSFRNLTTGKPEAPSPRGVAESESLEEEAIEIGNSHPVY